MLSRIHTIPGERDKEETVLSDDVKENIISIGKIKEIRKE